jgi:hypothetical protein
LLAMLRSLSRMEFYHSYISELMSPRSDNMIYVDA